jgi:hypothetical protein
LEKRTVIITNTGKKLLLASIYGQKNSMPAIRRKEQLIYIFLMAAYNRLYHITMIKKKVSPGNMIKTAML